MGVFRTFILLAGMTALFVGVGFIIGGETGMMIAFVVALGMNVFAYWNSDKVVLRMYKAVEITPQSQPKLFHMIENLAHNAQIPTPKMYLIQQDQPNAFATGRNPQNAAVALTTGLLQRLNEKEIAGVMAHELAHVKNRDTLIMTITATIAGAIGMLAQFGIFFGGNRSRFGPIAVILIAILAPLAAMLVQMAISRTREYAADRMGAKICGDPMSLATALEKIAAPAQSITNQKAEDNPATAHMFIINPLHARSMDKLFSTHPNTDNRIRELKKLAAEMGTHVSSPVDVKNPWG